MCYIFFCEGRYIPGRLSGVDEAGISKKYTRSTQGGVNDRPGYIKALWYWVVKTTPFIYTASHIKIKAVLGKCSTNVGFRMPYIYMSNSLNICLGSHARRLSTILQFI